MNKKFINDVLQNASNIAIKNNDEYVTIEHVLTVLVDMKPIELLCREFGIDVSNVKSDLQKYFQEKVPKSKEPPCETAALMKYCTYVVYCSQQLGKDIDEKLLIASIFMFKDTYAYYYLIKNGFTEDKFNNYIAGVAGQKMETPQKDSYIINMTEMAKQGKYDRFIGRDDELDKIETMLVRKKKNSVLIVGQPGCGKTAIAEGLAIAISKDKVPDYLKGKQMYSMDVSSIIAGTKFRGELEERVRDAINSVIKRKGILFVDEIHTFVGGGSNNAPYDVSSIFKTFLTDGEFKCIGTTTDDDYKTTIAKDKAFARRFQRIDISEPSFDDTKNILKGILPSYEKHYEVNYDEKCLDTIITLTQKYIVDRHLPDKAIDMLDQVGADNFKNAKKKIIRVADVERVISGLLKLPLESVTDNDLDKIKKLDERLKEKIFGQDRAVAEVVQAIKLSKAGLTRKDKPICNFLAAGPTGSGKTELAKQLAHNLGVGFIRIDMSEYSEKHSIAKFIGSPAGYVGFEQGGQFVDIVLKNPHSVILLDEIEKADPAVHNVLLQIMDYGFLTDGLGRKADFRHCILLMTTNAGSQEMTSSRTVIGFGNEETKIPVTEIEKRFAPEFRNRLDAVVHFNSMTKDLLVKVVDKFVDEFNELIVSKNAKVELTESAKDYFASKAVDEKMGARPIARYINSLKNSLVDSLLFEVNKKMKTFVFDLIDGEVKLKT